MPKIALAVISKDTKEEAELLKRLINSVQHYVDGFFITAASTSFPGHVKKVCEEYGATYSEFNWIKDFSAARNFNFSQVTEDYDFILWSDVDDVWRGLEKLPKYFEDNKHADGFAFWYLYGFDEDKQPIVVHKKTMLIKNDGSFIWKGAIHEDLDNERIIDIRFIDDIHRIHDTTDERVINAKDRNLEIAQTSYEKDKNDPRNHFNLGNALIAIQDYSGAIKIFEDFVVKTGSDEEKCLIYQRLAWAHHHNNNRDAAETCMLIAIGILPNEPDPYLELGKMYFEWNNLDKAETYSLIGLTRKPSYKAVSVFNPRDYDYNPMLLLSKIYFLKGRPDLALVPIQNALKINDNERLRKLEKKMLKQTEELKKVITIIEKLKKITNKDQLAKELYKVPAKFKSHPGICMIRNQAFIKETSTGKDVVYYCGYTESEWNPDLFKTKGFGGSEEAVIHLSKRLAEKGLNVTVYANIGPEEMVREGVTWKPYWDFNSRDKVDHLILWRSPRMCDYDVNADHIYIDLHDVIGKTEFTKKRLEKIDKIFVKTNAHKILFPNVPEEKFAVVPNGLNLEDFEGEYEKDQYLIINTSSPDRSMESFAKIAKQVKEQIPDATFKWAYGWNLYDLFFKGDRDKMEWKRKTQKALDDAGVETLGRITQSEVAELYKKANILLYPSEFYEIDCISVKKAQLAGCKVITTDFAAMDESVQHGVKIHSKKDYTNWNMPYQKSFACDESLIDAFVDETVKALKEETDRKEMKKWAKKFSWDIIGDNWYNEMYGY